MPFSQQQQDQQRKTGASGGTVNTNGMSSQDRQTTDKNVNAGRNGK
jgi:hypothetical protein